ncbi:MAG: helix-turn-helix domain-containing protein, partial [Paludibacter sp.]
MSNSLIAEKIRTLMADRNVDIDDLAQRSGLKKEAIETILNDNKIPSLAPIIKIARALGVRPGTFLDDSEHLGPVVNRK